MIDKIILWLDESEERAREIIESIERSFAEMLWGIICSFTDDMDRKKWFGVREIKNNTAVNRLLFYYSDEEIHKMIVCIQLTRDQIRDILSASRIYIDKSDVDRYLKSISASFEFPVKILEEEG